MTPLAWLALAAITFVGSHLLLSHPLRGPLAARLGEKGFMAVYVPVALVTFGLMWLAASRTPPELPLWVAGDGLWAVATLLMWLGSILFVGSFRRNPALPRPGGPPTEIAPPTGVFRITRHPMNWGFAIWGIVHIAVIADPSGMIIGAAILVLALVGSAGQDSKKRRQIGAAWEEWVRRTSFVPFGRGLAWPGAFAFVGGTLFFLLATWLHQRMAPMPAGIWRWIG